MEDNRHVQTIQFSLGYFYLFWQVLILAQLYIYFLFKCCQSFFFYWFYEHHWLASFYLSVRQIWVSSTSAYMFLASVCSVLWTWLIHICQISPHGAGWKTANMTSEWITGAAVAAVCLQCGEQDVCLGSLLTTCDLVVLHFHPSTKSGPQDWSNSDDEQPEEDVTEGTSCIFSASILEFQEVHSTPPLTWRIIMVWTVLSSRFLPGISVHSCESWLRHTLSGKNQSSFAAQSCQAEFLLRLWTISRFIRYQIKVIIPA